MVEFSKLIRKDRKNEDGPNIRPVTENISSVERGINKGVRDEDLLRNQHSVPVQPIKPLFTQRTPSVESYAETMQSQPPSIGLPQQSTFAPPPAAILKDPLEFYQKMMGLARKLLTVDVKYEDIDPQPMVDIVSEAAIAISAGDEKIVELAITYILKDEEIYLFQHSVNVCILSLLVGHGLNYDKEKMMDLGLAAFLHDIGMSAYEDMAQVPRRLTAKEYEELKHHVETGDRILKKINGGLSEAIITAQHEIHERLDGSGYPTGKKIIHDLARIIALVDAFESLIHPRPFRPRYSIMEVYKRIFDAKTKYDQSFMKVMVDKLGFFPNGSYVQLNTKEVGRVIAQNTKSPLRPIVKIIHSVDGHRIEEANAKEVNLTKYPTIHIKKCFLEMDVEMNEKGEA